MDKRGFFDIRISSESKNRNRKGDFYVLQFRINRGFSSGYIAIPYIFYLHCPSSTMEFPEHPVYEKEVETAAGLFTLRVAEEDLSAIYPGMIRYSLRLFLGMREIAVFRTNTYEYTPTDPLDAKDAALHKAAEWESGLHGDTGLFLFLVVPEAGPSPVQNTSCRSYHFTGQSACRW